VTAVGTRETPRERLAYHGYALAERLARALPERWSRAVFAALGRLAHAALPGVRATVARNLARVLGRPPDDPLVRAATREAFDLYARYWHDTFRLPAMGPEVVRARFRVEGLEHLDAALARGRGAICVAPHMGNWDAAGAGSPRRGTGRWRWPSGSAPSGSTDCSSDTASGSGSGSSPSSRAAGSPAASPSTSRRTGSWG